MRQVGGVLGEDVEAELARWAAAGQRPRLFLRDDDAASDTPALRRLIDLIGRHDAPLLLAAIPAQADHSLGQAVRDEPLVTAAVHGWAHRNHAPFGEKTCELGRHRPAEIVIGELAKGRDKLADLFDGRLSQLLVPPWNRIHAEILERVGQAGFTGVSAHGWLDRHLPVTPVNVHIDIIHWSGGGVGRDPGWISAELARNLAEARRRGFRAVGILAHHLAHDTTAWAGIEAIFDCLGPDRADWIAADDLILEPREPLPADQA